MLEKSKTAIAGALEARIEEVDRVIQFEVRSIEEDEASLKIRTRVVIATNRVVNETHDRSTITNLDEVVYSKTGDGSYFFSSVNNDATNQFAGATVTHHGIRNASDEEYERYEETVQSVHDVYDSLVDVINSLNDVVSHKMLIRANFEIEDFALVSGSDLSIANFDLGSVYFDDVYVDALTSKLSPQALSLFNKFYRSFGVEFEDIEIFESDGRIELLTSVSEAQKDMIEAVDCEIVHRLYTTLVDLNSANLETGEPIENQPIDIECDISIWANDEDKEYKPIA